MPDDKHPGYYGSALEWLISNKLQVWNIIEIRKGNSTLKGTILPRSELAAPNFISLKLSTGYNIGFCVDGIESVIKHDYWKGEYRVPKTEISQKPNLPYIPILGCGGTIASRLDYQTGGTIPTLTPEELFSSFPEIANLAQVETKLLFEILSENIGFKHYNKILTEIERIIKTKSPQGIVLTHGTDTMSFTAAALSFGLENPPVPIVVTGSQRSSDRPSSDSFFNLYNSVLYASSEQARKEVVVIMHEDSSDNSCSIHRGTRVRKMHSSRRDAFRTIGSMPLGRIQNEKIHFFESEEKPLKLKPENSEFRVRKKFEKKVGLIYHYPEIQSKVLKFYLDSGYKGLVLVGTGLGHISSKLIPVIKNAVESELVIIMTSQCLHGFTGLSVYETGRLLQKAGVIPVDILPETAFIKLAYLLGNFKDIDKVEKLMKMNLNGEILQREPFDQFP